MFIIEVKYTATIEQIDEYLVEHRNWLDTKYQQGALLCSGPKNPRVGGVIVSILSTKAEVEKLINEDPFKINNLATYTITEFNPVKMHDCLKGVVVG